ncbi:MAG: HEAT repeat domain-containing protein [Acidobacteriota bacterium]
MSIHRGQQVDVGELKNAPSSEVPRFSEELIHDCLKIMESGDIEDLFEIIPRIGVLRDPRFHEPLIRLLSQKDAKRCEFAAYAMGAMGNREFLEPLKKAFLQAQKIKGFGAQDFLIAVIEAIGSIGDDAAVDFFLPILQGSDPTGNARMLKWIVESLGAIAQQGGPRSIGALLEMTGHQNPDLRAQALSELAVAYWHRPNEIEDSTLKRIYELTTDRVAFVAESAVAALQSLADVGCRRAEDFFQNQDAPDS